MNCADKFDIKIKKEYHNVPEGYTTENTNGDRVYSMEYDETSEPNKFIYHKYYLDELLEVDLVNCTEKWSVKENIVVYDVNWDYGTYERNDLETELGVDSGEEHEMSANTLWCLYL